MSPPPDNNSLDEYLLENYVFRAIAECTYDWESWHRPDGKLAWVNAAVERITGYSAGECLQMADYPLALVATEDRSKIQATLQDAKAGGSGNDVEFRVAHRDSSSRWAAVSWQPMRDKLERHLGFRASVRDVTERHQLREVIRLHTQHLEQLVQERTVKIANLEQHRLKMEKLAALGQMAAGIAHEVNNPLAGIRNAFALFKSNLSPDDENYDLLDLVDSEIERISSITHHMYQLYRPSQQSPRHFDLHQTVVDVMTLLQPLATETKVQLTSETKDCCRVEQFDPTEVVLRESEVRQILLNLIRNAIQAAPSGSTVLIEISTTESGVSVAVMDEGEGVSDNVASRIFEPFFSTKTSPREGMGLGMSVSRSLAEAMGGRITIHNNKKRGACVTLALPRQMMSD